MRRTLTALVCGCMMAAVALAGDTAADLGPRLTAAGETRTVSVPLAGVAKIVAGRETIFETDGPGGRVPDLAPEAPGPGPPARSPRTFRKKMRLASTQRRSPLSRGVVFVIGQLGWQMGEARARAVRTACACMIIGASLTGRHAAALDLATPPAWTSYAITEALVMGRDNQAANQPLITETGAPENVLVSTPDLQFPFGGGFRGFYGARNPDVSGWEIGYFGLYGQSASASAATSGTTFLEAPGPLGYDLTSAAQQATVTWNSTITSVEANVFRTATDRARSADGWWTVDWLAGFRYVGVEETAALDILSCGDRGPLVPYRVGTSNNLFGGQLGARGRLDRDRWAFEGWAKAGLFGNAQTLRQDAVVDWLGYEQRPAASATAGETAFVGDINLSAIYRLSDVWGIRAGYNTIWIGGVALAPDQFTFGMDGPLQAVAGGGGIFLHGVNLGLEARW